MASGNKCSFFNCGKSKWICPNLQIYGFPKDEELCKQWVVNSGNKNLLMLSPETLNRKYKVCSNHFEPKHFMNPQTKIRLMKGAIPNPYSSGEPEDLLARPSTSSSSPSKSAHGVNPTLSENCFFKPIRRYQRSNVPKRQLIFDDENVDVEEDAKSVNVSLSDQTWLNTVIDMPETSPGKLRQKRKVSEDTPRKKKLKRNLENQRRLAKNQRSTISRLRSTLKKKTQDATLTNIIGNVRFVSKASKTLTKMQVLHRRNSRWSKDEKEFALQVFYKSPSAYKFMRKNLQVVLPSLATIRQWIGDSKFKTGFSLKFLNNLQTKISTMDNLTKECTLVFDEMKIKENIEYSKLLDLIEGFEDLGSLGRGSSYGSQVMVFMLRGLYSPWKMPFSYFVCTNAMKHTSLKELIVLNVQKAYSVGLKVRAIICDQGTNNQSALKNLGITEKQPYFFVDGKKIISIFDVPHLFKNFRNHWLKDDFLFIDQKISFHDIRQIYNLDVASKTGRSLMKITSSHIEPGPFQKMKCSLALQIFSKSVAATIRTAVGTGELKSATALNTANFLEFMNNLFDALNSKRLFTKNPYNCAISEENPTAKSVIMDGIEKISKIKKITSKGMEIPPCFLGLRKTLVAVLELYNDQRQRGYKFILTNRLNQDVIENSFSTFRQRGGFNPNPTVRAFRATFRICAKMQLMRGSEVSNCEDDEDVHLISKVVTNPAEIGKSQIENSSDSDIISVSSSSSSSNTCKVVGSSSVKEVVDLEDCSNTYFAGYLAKVCLDKFKCQKCEKLLCGELDLRDKKQLLILYKDYGKKIEYLRIPSNDLILFVEKSLKVIKQKLDLAPHVTFIKKRLTLKIKRKVKESLFDPSCEKHKDFLIEKLIATKIFKECKWRSNSIKTKKNSHKQIPKLKILKSM